MPESISLMASHASHCNHCLLSGLQRRPFSFFKWVLVSRSLQWPFQMPELTVLTMCAHIYIYYIYIYIIYIYIYIYTFVCVIKDGIWLKIWQWYSSSILGSWNSQYDPAGISGPSTHQLIFPMHKVEKAIFGWTPTDSQKHGSYTISFIRIDCTYVGSIDIQISNTWTFCWFNQIPCRSRS